MKNTEFTINTQLAHQAKLVQNQQLLNMRKPVKFADKKQVQKGVKTDPTTWKIV